MFFCRVKMCSGSTLEALRDKSLQSMWSGLSWIFTFYNINFLNKALYQVLLCCFPSINDNWNKFALFCRSFCCDITLLRTICPMFPSSSGACRVLTSLFSLLTKFIRRVLTGISWILSVKAQMHSEHEHKWGKLLKYHDYLHVMVREKKSYLTDVRRVSYQTSMMT